MCIDALLRVNRASQCQQRFIIEQELRDTCAKISHMGFFSSYLNSPLGFIIGVITIISLIHAVTRRADVYWFFIILFIPFIGPSIYFVSNVLPDLRRGNLSGALEGLKPTGMRVRDLEKQLEEVDTAQNRIQLAAAYRDAGELEKAEGMLEKARQGVFRNDPHVMFDLADVQFRGGKTEESVALLRELLPNAPEELRSKTRSLLAQQIEATNPVEAESLYRAALAGAPGEEAKYRLASFLHRQGQRDEALRLAKDIERNGRRASGAYRMQQREWLEGASKLLREP
jgi:hypothetical protein